jgi:hypothetical protein
LYLLVRHSTTWSTLLAFFVLFCSLSFFCLKASLRLWSSYPCLSNSCVYRHDPPCPTYSLRWSLTNFLPRLASWSSQFLPPE